LWYRGSPVRTRSSTQKAKASKKFEAFFVGLSFVRFKGF